jgi:alpha-L-rhamnosidase
MKNRYIGVFIALVCTIIGFNQEKTVVSDPIKEGFLNPPDSVRISTFYYWLNNHVSKEGVVKDLYAMKKAGITRVFIGTNIRNRTNMSRDVSGQYFGKVAVFSDEWWEALHTALKTAAELDIEVGLFNCPGWSQSGGPWIKPEQAMRYLDASEIRVQGPVKISLSLPKPDAFFQDVKVLAIKVNPQYEQNLLESAGVTIVPQNLNVIKGDNKQSKYALAGKEGILDIDLPKETVIRSLTLYPGDYFNATVSVSVKTENGYKVVQTADVFRAREVPDLARGFEPHSPFALSLGEVKANIIRLTFKNNETAAGYLDHIALSATPVLSNLNEKKLAKVTGSTQGWGTAKDVAYPTVPPDVVLPDKKDVIDISQYMSADGKLEWTAPKGDWIIMRTGMTFIDVRNGPASFEAEGLEVDKMNEEAIRFHFDSFIGQILKRIPATDRKTFKMVIMDSYERGGLNFTDTFLADFKNKYGYDATPYLPVYRGHIIGSIELSERFLWDVRRLVADKISYDYVGGMRQICHENGLTTWLENYGHSGYPGEFLQYGGQSDEVAGEYWVRPINDRAFECRAASSAAHIYGKNKVWAESFTAGSWTENLGYSTYPQELKNIGDFAFTQGVNSTVFHLYIHQPYEDHYPGIDAWFGTEFNRKNTWFEHLDLFNLYHRRCNFMLQQGKNVADVAYYIGEDNPIMNGTQEPALPKGFNFDYINAEVIIRDMAVKDGRLVLPNGTSYRVLVLPQQQAMRPEVLSKIEQLVAAGGVIIGSPPTRSPGLQDYPNADKRVQETANKIWGNGAAGRHNYKQGIAFNKVPLEEVFNVLKVAPDCFTDNEAVRFTHREINGREIYFVANITDTPIEFKATFRVNGLQPELWDALEGNTRLLPAFEQKDETTTVPLKLAAKGSAFIVFDKKGAPKSNDLAVNFPRPVTMSAINSPWKVTFEHDSIHRGPDKPLIFNELKDWSQSGDDRIKYYSGKAIYETSVTVKGLPKNKTLYLNLGDLTATAKVWVNGIYVGGVWTAPYQVDVSKALVKGKNTLKIEVINTWKNRLVGDYKLPENKRKVQNKNNKWTADTPLQKSGLFGPVTLSTVEYSK